MKLKFAIVTAIWTLSQMAFAQKIGQKEARADIDTLAYVLSEVHPNLYTNIGMGELQRAFAEAKAEIPDSVSKAELYGKIAPIVARLGDAHTTIALPYNEIMAEVGEFIPVYPTIDNNTGRMYVKASVDNCVPYDSEIISINNVSAKEMVEKMKDFVSGEREFFKLSMIDNNIMGLLHYLYAAKKYTIVYRKPGSKKALTTTVTPVSSVEFQSRLEISPKLIKLMEEHSGEEAYSFRILEGEKVAVMTFDACINAKKMEALADSMVATLKEKGIKHLIIDVRLNGGGDSKVGDALLRHIAPQPFTQFGQTFIRITPTTNALLSKTRRQKTGVYFYPENSYDLKTPLVKEKRFDGEIFLLTSHTTFSSASSFAWAFKKYGCGQVIGEETGGMSVHYGDVLTFVMPHSGLSCNISHKRFWQPGANENEIHGLLPDVKIEQDKALDEALRIIKKKRK